MQKLLEDAQAKHINAAEAALKLYVETGKAGKGVKFDIESTDFRKAVWDALRKVPAGKTLSYADLALKAGVNPQAARAVGSAMANNPCPKRAPVKCWFVCTPVASIHQTSRSAPVPFPICWMQD